jgi:chemotaxis protein CheD
MKSRGAAALAGAPALPGFRHVSRYFDPNRAKIAAKILPGEYYVTRESEVIVTVLGSCVSACIWDPAGRVGGMNHFMLPESGDRDVRGDQIAAATDGARYGSVAMEQLINALLKHGGCRERLRVKIVGGGRVLAGATDVGARNIAFVREFIRNENLTLVGEHLGSIFPRKVCFDPLNGRAQVQEIRSMPKATFFRREREYQAHLVQITSGGAIELF